MMSNNATYGQWTTDQAWQWSNSMPWPCGFNYIPANAISYTEMWMDYCFNPDEIDREMKMAQDVGFNCARVVLPFVVWEHDPEVFKQRLDKFLEICQRHQIRVMPALFDDCAFGPDANPVFGRRSDVIPGWYANGWTPSPGHDIVRNQQEWPRLEKYVKDVIGSFKDDARLWVWDLYNEPTNGVSIGSLHLPLGNVSLPLVTSVFRWAREINPQQPLTIGKWIDNLELNDIALNWSDIITFHNYGSPEKLEKDIKDLKHYGRPIICTEWMNRNIESTVADCLPVFQQEVVGAIHWGLVNGKTQTHLNWGHLPGDPEPKFWQHDLYGGDYSPYDLSEISAFRNAIKAMANSRT